MSVSMRYNGVAINIYCTRRRVVASRIIRFHRRCKSKQQTSDPAEFEPSFSIRSDHDPYTKEEDASFLCRVRRTLREYERSIGGVINRECEVLDSDF
jgi:hypothetical protein